MKRNIPKDLHNFKQSYLYPFVGISGDCRVINWRTKSIINPHICAGYYSFSIKCGVSSKRVLLHRLIAERFIPTDVDISVHQVNHKDGNKLNNSLDNLEWVSLVDNVLHANNSGLRDSCKGVNHHGCKVTEYEVTRACMYMSLHLSNKEVERIVGLPNGFCNDIRRGKIWREISSQHTIPSKSCKATLLYIVALDNKYLKFGRTNNIKRRMVETRYNSKPFDVELLHCFDMGCENLARYVETGIRSLNIETSVLNAGALPKGFSETTYIENLPTILEFIHKHKPA